MDDERRTIIRKVYLSAIADHADKINRLARKISGARYYRDLTGTELANATKTGDLTLEEAGLVDNMPTLVRLIEMEDNLQDMVYGLQSCFEV